jgi:hypothetical protein
MLPNETITSMKNKIGKYTGNTAHLRKKSQATNPNTFES